MLAQFVRFGSRFALLSALILVGCSSEPLLVSKNPVVPAGVDLSGRWTVRADLNARRSQMGGGQEKLVLPSQSKRQRRQRYSSDVSAQVFLEYGESLKITQTDFGIFISYDRSIVEEFTFGENRMVSVGPIEARRVSGWEGNSFVVETLDDSGTTLFESWHLESDNAVLVRDIQMSEDEEESFRLRQHFDRE